MSSDSSSRFASPETEPPITIPSLNSQAAAVRTLIDHTAKLMKAEKLLVTLSDPIRSELIAVDCSLGFAPEQLRDFRSPLSGGITGAVYATGEPAVVSSDTLSLQDLGGLRTLGVRNALIMPILYPERTLRGDVIEHRVGVIHAINRSEGDFSKTDERILSVLGTQVSQLIAYTELYPLALHAVRQYRDIFQSMNIGFMAVNAQGVVFHANDLIRRLKISARAIGRSYHEVLKESPKFVSDIIYKVFRSKESEGTEAPWPITNEDGTQETHVYRLQVDPVFNQSLDAKVEFGGVVLLLMDVTSAKDDGAEDEYVSDVSHEFRTPLTSIQGYAQTLIEGYESEEPYDKDMSEEFLRYILYNSRHMLRLVEDLLASQRLSKGKTIDLRLMDFSLIDAIRSTVETQKSFSQPIFEFQVNIDPGLDRIIADQGRIEQVLSNYLSNAVKYSPDGGVIAIDARLENDQVTVSVTDHGIGIPPDALEKLYERLYRVESDLHKGIKGTGLGLYLCKILIELHGGNVNVESEYGKGSKFSFSLPLKKP
jgi:two-component system sensor histidine kinase VicK